MTQQPDTKKLADFMAEYEALCKKYGLSIRPQIFFKQQIDETFTIGASLTVISLESINDWK